jgi:hypothetical protein
MVVRLSALRDYRPILAEIFLVLISVRGSVDHRAIVRQEGLGQLKKSNYLIGIRNRDLSACSIVLQPTTLPRAPKYWLYLLQINNNDKEIVSNRR